MAGTDTKLAQKFLAQVCGRKAKLNVDELASYVCAKYKKPYIGRGPYSRARYAVRILKYVGLNDLAAELDSELYAKITARAKSRNRAPSKVSSHDFYNSDAWKRLRYQALKLHGAACQCCGATRADGVQIHVDHIKPRSKYPRLELQLSNLQILCEPCNMGKSALDETDWREQPKGRDMVIWGDKWLD